MLHPNYLAAWLIGACLVLAIWSMIMDHYLIDFTEDDNYVRRKTP
jgi:hypothetical protein